VVAHELLNRRTHAEAARIARIGVGRPAQCGRPEVVVDDVALAVAEFQDALAERVAGDEPQQIGRLRKAAALEEAEEEGLARSDRPAEPRAVAIVAQRRERLPETVARPA